jgi:hypothetical protein
VSNPIESKLVIQFLEEGRWVNLSTYDLNQIQTAYKVYNQLTAQTLDIYRLVNVKTDLLATNQVEAK